ncbi:alpha-1,2-fucosyltransferase [Hufsiella ginkgonis]|uniref:Alpha-1,2-fucosyltransferase n=1 Tax=Hufsiella ginkgonis TaxID=2695274 RepID=A0A7K1Y2M1_9SPHI|nr:alpha-1,2-fucosyltransferase [Hufsiella ginkgonis]MXV17462.1 alpha-1,2-fucosyltransferase [Hufsiella ginkgonis]
MIVVTLLGGLGNQMFQYAFGRHLAIKNKSRLVVDLSMLLARNPEIDYTFREFELDVFNVSFSNFNDVRNTFGYRLARKLKQVTYLNEDGKPFDPALLQIKGDAHLIGYWQTEKYFAEVSDVLRNDFTFKIPPGPGSQHVIDAIVHSNAVAIHFRRGDYVSLPSASIHGVCSPDYYRQAMAYIEANVVNPHYFIFSDDIPWVKANITFPGQHTFVEGNDGKKSFEDLRLMSLCKHNIIANSSFSWWGAWLNANKRKIVVAPKAWFRDPSVNASDLIPETWIRI